MTGRSISYNLEEPLDFTVGILYTKSMKEVSKLQITITTQIHSITFELTFEQLNALMGVLTPEQQDEFTALIHSTL